MTARMPFLTITVLLLVAAPAATQEKSPAELLSADVLGYAELHQPKQLARELSALVKNSALGNVPFSLAKIRGQYEIALAGRRGAEEEILIPGMMLAPEVLREAERVKGVAAALYDMNMLEGKFKFVVLVQPGDSNVPAYLARLALLQGRPESIEKFEGVQLYGVPNGFGGIFGGGHHHGHGFEDIKPGFDKREDKAFPDNKDETKEKRCGEQPQPPGAGPGPAPGPKSKYQGSVFALLPNLVVFGTHDAVRDVILRSKGKGKGPTLAQSKRFQDVRKDYGANPGVFSFVDMKKYVEVYTQMLGQGPLAPGMQQMIQMMTNPEAMPAAAYHVTINKGDLRYRHITYLNPKVKNPMLELLPTAPPNTDVLHFAPSNSIVVGVLSNRGKKGRFKKVLDFIDNIVAATGAPGPLPSQQVKQFEQQLNIDFAKDVVDQITDAGMALGDLFTAPIKRTTVKGPGFQSTNTQTQVPIVFFVKTKDAKGATKLTDKILPAVLQQFGGAPLKHVNVKGHKIYSLEMNPGNLMHFGRHNDVIVIGTERLQVVQSLIDGAAKKGWLSQPAAKEQLKNVKDSIAFAVVKPVSAIVAGILMENRGQGQSFGRDAPVAPPGVIPAPAPFPGGKERANRPPPPPLPPPPPGAVIFQPAAGGTKVEIIENKQGQKIKKMLGKLLANEPMMYFQYKVTKERIELDGRVSGVQPVAAKAIDLAVDQYYLSLARRYDPLFGRDVKALLKKKDALTPNDPLDVLRQNSHHKVHVVKMKAGKEYVIDMTANFDTYLRLEDARGNNLRQDDDGGQGLNSRIRFRPDRDGDYRIIATSLGRATGPYNVLVREVSD